MIARTLVLIAAFLSEALPAVRSEETAAAPKAARYREALQSIDAEMANSIAIFREEVNAGKEEDGWSAEVKEKALRWVKDEPSLNPRPEPPWYDPAKPNAPMVLRTMRLNDPKNRLQPPASVLAAWLRSRTSLLRERKNAALAEYAGELAAFAEDIWIKAEKPADLHPVTAAFAELEALAPSYLEQTNLPSAMMPRMPQGVTSPAARQLAALQDPRRVEAFYAALFTAEDDPLIFPNPKTDAEGYTKARVTWGLLSFAQTPFQTRPRVQARVTELDTQYYAAREFAHERLNALILENAPAAVFEPALNHFNAFQDHFNPREWVPPQMWRSIGRPQMPPMPKMLADGEGRLYPVWSTQGQIHSYHDLLGPQAGSPPGPMMGGIPWGVQERQIQSSLAHNSSFGIHKFYGQWLDYRRAEERGAAPAELATLWEEFQHLNYLPLNLQAAVRKRRESPGAGEIAGAPGTHPASPEKSPVAELVAELEGLVIRIQNERPAGQADFGDLQSRITALLDEWRGLDRKVEEVSQLTNARDLASMAWPALAERPDCLTLFALREKAVRYALAQILSIRGGPAWDAFPTRKALEMSLEKSALDNDWPRFRRILRLGYAGAMLANTGRMNWAQMEADQSAPAAARRIYLQILRTSDNPAIIDIAIRRLEALPEKETPP